MVGTWRADRNRNFSGSDAVRIAVLLLARVYDVTARSKRFKRGDRVSWNSEAGRVSGRIIRVHTKDVGYKGYVHHASEENPQYEIKSDKTDHVALHKGSALRRMCR
jgi:hypothetical protein